MLKLRPINQIANRLNSSVAFTNPGEISEAPAIAPVSVSVFSGYHDTVDLKARVFEPAKSLLPKAEYLPKEPIVFLHGIFGNSRMYSKQSQLVANNLRTPVISVDLRSHGQSPRAMPMNYPAFVEDVAKFVRDNNLGKVNMTGFSLGAKVAMLYSLAYPDTVARTVVIDNSPVQQNDIQNFLNEYADGLIKIIDNAKIKSSDNDWYEKANDVLKTVVKDPVGRKYLMSTNLMREHPETPDGYIHLILPVKQFRELIQENVGSWPDEFISGCSFDGPTLFIKATQSPFIRKSHLPTIESYFPNYNIEKIKSTHLLLDERPDLFVTKLTNWFKQHPIN